MYWNKKTDMLLSAGSWLTLTWDVLKYYRSTHKVRRAYRLTLTWDVLKFTTSAGICTKPTWLTLTWDVLKF